MQNVKRTTFTEGPLFSKMILFVLPIMLTGILQLLYNSADSIIVGRFSGDPNALGAVGCTSTTTGLLINMLLGLGAGTSVLVSQFYGAKNNEGVSRAVHTSLTAGFIGGVVILVIGQLVGGHLLTLLGTKSDLYDSALLYVRIIFLGVPASAVLNFGAAIVRSLGDSKTPLIILSSTGLLNVLLNLLFVIVFDMSVAGVALATIISQYVSAVAILVVLIRTDGPHRFYFSRIGINGAMLRRMLRIAIPSAIQSSLFSISNMTLQGAINTFSSDAVSGNAIASTLEGFIYTTLNSFYTATLTFIGQNYGAKKIERTARIARLSILQVTVVGLSLGTLMMIFAKPLSLMFVDPGASNLNEVVNACVERLSVVLIPYVLCGYMETMTGFLRGYGYSLLPMISSVFCVCVLRVLWVSLIFPLDAFNNPTGLFVVYPITWMLATAIQGTMAIVIFKRHNNQALQAER